MDSIALKSPAKVNLFLEVLSKREDGFHELETVMQEIDFCDEIDIEKTAKSGIEVEVPKRDCLSGKDNLAYKAAFLFSQEVREAQGLKITITKNIPVGGGLGGGSSNGAYVLRGLNKMHNNVLSEEELLKLASKLGSDVAFFIKGGTKLCRGRGEIIEEELSFPQLVYVLVNPGIEISTREIYGKLNLNLTREIRKFHTIKNLFKGGDLLKISGLLYNRLEQVIFDGYPYLKEITGKLKQYGALNSLVSGSGATIFGIVESREKASYIKKKIEQEIEGLVLVTEPYNNQGKQLRKE